MSLFLLRWKARAFIAPVSSASVDFVRAERSPQFKYQVTSETWISILARRLLLLSGMALRETKFPSRCHLDLKHRLDDGHVADGQHSAGRPAFGPKQPF